MNRPAEIGQLIRVFNCLMVTAAVMVGGLMAGLSAGDISLILAAIAAFFVCAAGNIGNDLRDLAIDRISHPGRPLAAGRVSLRAAQVLGISSNILALILAALSSRAVLLLVVAVITLLYAYNAYLKRIPLLGNLVVAALAGLTVITGSLSADHLPKAIVANMLWPSLIVFLFHLTREVIKDAEDIEGDSRANLRTLPQILGVSQTTTAVLCIFAGALLATLVPIWLAWYSQWYALIAVLLVDLPVLVLLVRLRLDPTPRNLHTASQSLKAALFFGLIALYLA